MRYLVRCICCDRAFWQAERASLLPEHAAWERRATAHTERDGGCAGGRRPGHWIGEGEGPIRGWPRGGNSEGGSEPEPDSDA